MSLWKARLLSWVAVGLIIFLAWRWGTNIPAAYAADCVAGPHSGTLTASQDWCPEHNPHIISSSVTVPDNVTLTLRPGVIVKTASGHYLRVTGVLNAIGTPAEPITLTSSTDSGPGQWAGLYLHSGEATLKHVTVRYAGQYNTWGYAAINVAYSTLHLENSVVRDSANPSVPDYGVHLCCSGGSASAVISGTLFANLGNNTSDVAVFSESLNNPVQVVNSTFQNNTGYPISIPATLVHQINGNTFSGNGFNRILIMGDQEQNVANGTRLTAQAGLEGYEVKFSLRVPAGQTMYIDPGVMIMSRNNTDIRVFGHLEAIGTPAQPITFTSATNTAPEQWGNLYAQDGSLDLRYVTIRYGGQLIMGNQVAGALLLQSTGGTPRHFNLDHVTVRDNAYTGGATELAINVNGGTVAMNEVAVINNGNSTADRGINVNAGQVSAVNTRVQNNAGIGVYVAGGSAGFTCGTISGNGADGIRVTGGSGLAVIGMGITNNTGLGINNTTVQNITAAYNWWGDPSGPGGQGPGSGDEVSANVSFAPWLTAEGCFTGLFIGKKAVDLNGAPLFAGDEIQYTIQVTNTGNILQTNLVVTDTLPAGVTFVEATPEGYTPGSPTPGTPLRWAAGSLAPGGTWTGVVVVKVNDNVSAIGGNVAQAASDQQAKIQTAEVFPAGGGGIWRKNFLPLVVR